MSELSDVRAALRELAEPRPVGDFVKVAIARAARATGLSYWRAFDLWYGKARSIEKDEHKRIAEAMERKRREAARNELHELRLRIVRLEALIQRAVPGMDGISPTEDRQRRRPQD